MQFLDCCFIVSRCIKPNLGLVEAWDLNFFLCSEIFVHYNVQLQTSHLILGCTPSYTNYQAPGLAFLVSNLLLTYIDVRIPGFLPNISVNKARRKGPRRVREGSREPIRDGSGDFVFHERLQHIPMNDPKEEEEDTDMVRWRNIEIGHYFPDV